MEILLTLLYALFIGFFNIFRKSAIKNSNESVVLVLFTTTAFLLSLIWVPFGVATSFNALLLLAAKGFIIALSWYLTLKVLKTTDLSMVTVTNALSGILSFIVGIFFFNETAGIWQIIGSTIIILGVAGVGFLNKDSKEDTTPLEFVVLLITALITTTSGTIDKTTTSLLTPQQVQFWFLLFACFFSWLFFAFDCIINKKLLIKKQDFKNPWIYLVGLFLFVGDFMLFSAYKTPNSQMITITILSKLQIVVTMIGGVLIFKENSFWKKLGLTAFIVLGAILIASF